MAADRARPKLSRAQIARMIEEATVDCYNVDEQHDGPWSRSRSISAVRCEGSWSAKPSRSCDSVASHRAGSSRSAVAGGARSASTSLRSTGPVPRRAGCGVDRGLPRLAAGRRRLVRQRGIAVSARAMTGERRDPHAEQDAPSTTGPPTERPAAGCARASRRPANAECHSIVVATTTNTGVGWKQVVTPGARP